MGRKTQGTVQKWNNAGIVGCKKNKLTMKTRALMSLQQIWSSVLMDGVNNLRRSAAARTKEWSEYEDEFQLPETRPKWVISAPMSSLNSRPMIVDNFWWLNKNKSKEFQQSKAHLDHQDGGKSPRESSHHISHMFFTAWRELHLQFHPKRGW